MHSHNRAPATLRRLPWLALLAVAAAVSAVGSRPSSSAAPQKPRAAATATKSTTAGTIEGTVVYRADRKRPWRYARYYVRDRKKGYLAESVVALRSTRLKNFAPPKRSRTTTVDQKDFRFIPETVAIRAGERIKFTNSDPQLHNVRSAGTLHEFDVTLQPRGAKTETFPRAGGIRRPVVLGCKLHSQMRAWVFVFDHPFYQVTEQNGRFRLQNVPPGEYRLEMVHSSGGLRWSKKIAVKPGQRLMLNVEVSPDDLVKTGS